MNRQSSIPIAHGALRDVLRDGAAEFSIELTVDERVDVAAVPEMIEAHHVGGNPGFGRLLPTE